MIRLLHQWLLRLHPPAFRRRFSPEMLCIFDHATASKSSCSFCEPSRGAVLFDAFVSLMRQWLLRSGSWRLPAAVAGASLQFLIGGFIFVSLSRGHAVRETAPAFDPALDNLMRIVLGVGCGLVLMIAAAAAWMTAFIRRRCSFAKAHNAFAVRLLKIGA
jgi:hypothetical protein